MLHLLALIAGGLGAKGLRDYQPASEQIEETLWGLGEQQGTPRDPAARRAEVLAFIAETGGEAG